MFKRNPRTWPRAVLEFFYPRGGWYRAAVYILHRVRRLPDPADRISRGVAAGVFVCFTPLFGLHFISAALLAWIIRGNRLAAVLATFVGNPITFPFIVELSMGLGSRLLGLPIEMHLPQVFEAFAGVTSNIWHNFLALFTAETAHWENMSTFYQKVFLPYLLGGLLPGLGSAMIAYGLSRPVITAYQKRRIKKIRKRYEKRMAERATALATQDPDASKHAETKP